MSYSIMSELLQFMYQGEVNVKQAELQAFMSIAESLQIKGLATSTNNSNSNNNSQTVRTSDAVNSSSYSQFQANNVARNHNQHHFNSGGNHPENHRQTTTPQSTASSVDNNQSMKGENLAIIFHNFSHSNQLHFFRLAGKMGDAAPFGQKRSMDQISERQSQTKVKRSQTMNDISDSDMNDSIDNMTSDEMFLPQVMQPQVTINESPRFDANTVKRETNDTQQPQSPNTSGFRGYRKRFNSANFRFHRLLKTFFHPQKTRTCKMPHIHLTTSRITETTT